VKIPCPLLGFSSRPPLTENPGYVSDDSYMKALKLLQAVIVRGKKNILPRNILGNKKSCAALLQEKNICLIPLGGKKLLHSLNLPPPPPPSPLKNQMVRPLL
jgi:hypothetical protein